MGGEQALVLIVEDEAAIRRFLRASLPLHGYRLVEAGTGAEALRLAVAERPDLVILDLGLPDMDGADVVRRLREWAETPIVVLSARDREADKIAALDAGADDYLTKPFGVGELLARLRVAARHAVRKATGGSPVLLVGDLAIDLPAHAVTLAGQELRLTPTEFRLLAALAKHAGKVVTHGFLIRELGGDDHEDAAHTLRVHISQLRRKLEAEPARPKLLQTEPGVGYRLRVDPPSEAR